MKIKLRLIAISCLLFVFPAYSQEAFDVTEQTIKIGGNSEEIIYFGFAAGDKIIFSFSEINGKEIKEVEIFEYPSTLKFSEYKISQIDNKIINVNKEAIYKFRFYNSTHLSSRICKIKIQRIAANDFTKNFNSNILWITKQDTTWNTYTKDIVIGYDTITVQKSRKELIKIDTVITELLNKTERVHSETAIGKTQNSYIDVHLPDNTYFPNNYNPYQSKELIAWSYWIGVGQNANAEYEQGNSKITDGISAIGALTGYSGLATLALTGISVFSSPTIGDNVQYQFQYMQNGKQYTFDTGNGIMASGRNDQLLQGAFTIKLYNDNLRDGIDVTVKVIALQLIKIWEDKKYTERKLKPRYIKKIFSDPIITTTKIPLIEKLE